MKFRKIAICCLLSSSLLLSSVVTFAAEPAELNVEGTVEYGLIASKKLELIENIIDIAKLTNSTYNSSSAELQEAEETLAAYEAALESNKAELDSAEALIIAAREMFDLGMAPSDVDLGGGITIPAGSKILDTLLAFGLDQATAEAKAELILQGILEEITKNEEEFNQKYTEYTEAYETIMLSRVEYEYTLADVTDKVNDKLGVASTVELTSEEAGSLMVKMAGVNLDVSRYAYDIYRDQIAMLIQKNFYDALYLQKVVEIKTIACDRGEAQFDASLLSYENGMKSKDDYLLSKMYYESTKLALRLAEAEYSNALIELKMNSGLDLETEIVLVEPEGIEVTEESLDDGIGSALVNRIEIKELLGLSKIYKLNKSIISEKYDESSNAYEEAELLYDGTEIELEDVSNEIESEVRQSYELMVGLGEMYEESRELVDDAEEVVKIAKLKYDEGFGAENALLNNLNLVQSSGTIIEVLAAEENLAEIQAQVASIKYNYQMSKVKFFNDSAILTYESDDDDDDDE